MADAVVAATRDHLPESGTLSGRPRVPLEKAKATPLFSISATVDTRSSCANALKIVSDVLGNAPWTPLDRAVEPRRTRELPAPYVVVDFGTGGAM